MSHAHEYKAISKQEEESQPLNSSESDQGNISPRWSQSKSEWARFIVPGLWAAGSFFLMAAIGLVMLFKAQASHHREILTYSPAQDVIQYHTMMYPDGIHHKTKYMGKPSPEIDAAWEADYDLISRIPKWQAEKLETRPDELPNDPGYYAVMLDIFHSLHCLNEIRMTLNADYYGVPHERLNTTEERTKIHLDHCLEHIRLSLWCNADLSPIPFQNGPNGLTASHHYSHTCRDTDAILQWARDNQVRAPF